MRWITPKELSKIAKKSQLAEKTIPERTLRHMALQKRITTKKEGKSYLIDPNSAIKAGLYISPEDLENLRIKKIKNAAEAPPSQPETEKNNKADKKSKRLGELGVYNELKSLYLAKKQHLPDPIKESIKQTLYHLALGFYDYPQVSKAEYFRRARKFLVGSIVEDDLNNETQSEWREQIENSIMPGIIGLIRKQEGGKRGGGSGPPFKPKVKT